MAAKRKPRKPTGNAAQDKLLYIVHQIWLAGLGAASKASQGTPRLLDELVAEGARVQAQQRGAAEKALRALVDTVNARVDQVRGQAADTLSNLEKIFQVRVHRALAQLGVPSGEEIEALSKRIDRLNESIDKVAGSRRRAARARAQLARKAAAAPPAH